MGTPFIAWPVLALVACNKEKADAPSSTPADPCGTA